MYLEIFLADFAVFRVFLGISRKYLNFAGPRPREISEALNRTIGMMCFSIGTNRTIGTNGLSEILPCTQQNHMENNLSPLMRCIFANRTIGMMAFSIGTNCTIQVPMDHRNCPVPR